MKRLTKAQVLALHAAMVRGFGGTDGLRDESLLDSALNAPFQAFSGAEAYPSILQKAARLGFGLIGNHAFLDGNKRTGAHAMLVFLAVNGIEMAYAQEELIEIILRVASGRADCSALAQWLLAHQA